MHEREVWSRAHAAELTVQRQVPALRNADLVLASGSPRRKEILNDILGLRVRVVASTFEEDLDKSKYTPQQYGLSCTHAPRRASLHALHHV